MQFVFPTFLWTLFILAIPVLIHLFYFRRYKKVEFTNVRFLKELVEETATRNRIKNLLILIARLCAIATLIFAFAQPFSNSGRTAIKQSQSISIYIDNSWSMDANSDDGSILQKAKRRARDIIRASSDNDRFQLITNDFEGKHQRLVSKDDALALLEEIKSGPAVQTLSKIITKQSQCFKNAGINQGIVYMISDFQRSICDLDSNLLDSSLQINLLLIQSVEENNVSIDTAYFDSPVLLPGQTQALIYKVSNYGNSTVENLSASYSVNGQEYPGKPIAIPSGKFKMDTFFIKIPDQSWQQLIIKIKDFPVQFDDSYYMCCKTDQQIDVLVLYAKEIPIFLIRALESIPFFKVSSQQQNQIDYSKLGNFRLIILNELAEVSTGMATELRKATQQACNLFIFPRPETALNDYSNLIPTLNIPQFTNFDTAAKLATKANLDSDIFKDVFNPSRDQIKLPSSFGQYTLSGGAAFENIITYRDGLPMISRIKSENASIFISACPLDQKFSDLSKNAELFLPLLFKAALASDRSQIYTYDLSNNPQINLTLQDLVNDKDFIISLNGPETFIPSFRVSSKNLIIDLYDQLKTSGIYQVKNQEMLLGYAAFNDSRRESNLDVISQEELSEKYSSFCKIINDNNNSDFTSVIKSERAGPFLWWYLLIASFIFLIVESLLIRFWKNH